MSSYKPRRAETRGVPAPVATSELSLPRVRKGLQRDAESNPTHAVAPKRSSVISLSSSGRLSSASGDYNSRQQQSKPSALPRSTSSSSQARLSYIASTRPMPTYAGKSPPLQALNLGAPITGIPRLDTSRAFSSTASGHSYRSQSLSPMDTEDDTVLGIVMPGKAYGYPSTVIPPQLIPELQALAASNSRLHNPASSSIGSISSPSTQFTTSSSPWSASTAATTPISWSSASPNVSQLAHSSSNKRSNTVPIPANVKTRVLKLPPVTETQPSAASSRVNLPSDPERKPRRTKVTIENTPDSTLPPRSSSLKRITSRSDGTITRRSEKQPELPLIIPSFPPPPASAVVPQKERLLRKEKPSASQGHSRLQEAINSDSRLAAAKTLPRASEEPKAIPTAYPCPRQLLEPAPIAPTSHRRFPSLSRRHVRGASSSETEVDKQSARSRLAKFSRLALFGRSKTVSEKEKQPVQTQPRKGPAAGTGHEGYGKFGRRGRKQSISSSVGAMDSETSLASTSRKPTEKRQSRVSGASRDQSDLDEFAAPRAKPVVIMGGSLRGRTNPFPPIPKNPQLSDVSLSTMSSADSYPAQTRLVSPRRERFLPEDNEPRPSLATRRSQKFTKSEDTFRFPEPIETQDLTATPCLDSHNTTQSSELPTPASAMYRVDPSMLEKQRSKSKRLKWNIFRRKDSISETAEEPVERPRTRQGMSVNVAPAPAARSVPYYALIGSETNVDNSATINQFLQEAAESPEKEEEISIRFSDDDGYDLYTHRESILLPSARQAPSPPPPPPQIRSRVPQIVSPVREDPESPERFAQSEQVEQAREVEEAEPTQPARRQPRLAQVGRIPKVISTRQQTQPNVEAEQILPAVPRLQVVPPVRTRPSREQLPRLRTRDQPTQVQRLIPTQPIIEIPETSPPRQVRSQSAEPEFLHFSERNSDFTTSSESTGIISIMGPPSIYIPASTRRQTNQFGHEDEVWKEYDDFMDDIMSPMSQQTKSPQKLKAKKPEKSSRITQPINSVREAANPRGLAIVPGPVPAAPSRHFLATPELGVSPLLHQMASSEEIRLRRSRIAPALHNSFAPSSPFSMRDFLDEYGRPISNVSDRLSGSSAQSTAAVQTLVPARPILLREQSAPREYESAAHLEEIERAHNPTRHSDRAYASLMVSRWLSFGRVLFSPAHNEIAANPERHVLVIDGLGSEDWSIYCAVTYQNERAYVHDLKERKAGKSQQRRPSISTDTVPPNHRRAELNHFTEKFPFPPGFFSAIVVRFPPAMPDSKLKNIISECRRTLAPGGYLELMVLDIDIVNMGVQTRRAIKDLKIKMSAADPNVSLKPIIDNVQTVLGSNGFPNLTKCIVGVPVVGKPAHSLDSSSESRSSAGSAAHIPGPSHRPGHTRTSSAGPRPYGSKDMSLKHTANFSLNDLVADHSENADAQIGRVVSRTARSWWQHCFEASLIADQKGERSVFSSREVLNECKTRAANFKLLIAYTQKPVIGAELAGKRRTMSEPMVPTLATAGSSKPRA